MPQLALNYDQRHALMRELDSVSMSQLMWGKAPMDASRFRGSAQLLASRGGLPPPSCGRSVDHAEQRADRQRRADLLPSVQLVPALAVHPHLATAPALASADYERPAGAV